MRLRSTCVWLQRIQIMVTSTGWAAYVHRCGSAPLWGGAGLIGLDC